MNLLKRLSVRSQDLAWLKTGPAAAADLFKRFFARASDVSLEADGPPAVNLLKRLSVRSPWLFRINAGSCNGCDVELATTACIPRYDVERLGCRYCGSPRHADVVLITGPLTAKVKDRVLRVWAEIPNPKVTVAVGICPVSGGVFREGYSIEGPLDRYIPIDVNVPGCPPRPQSILEGVLLARDIWLKRLEG